LGVTLRGLSRHTGENDRRLCRNPKIPRRLERTPDVRVFRAAIERYQPDAVRALHLMSLTEPLRPFGEGLFAIGTLNFDSVGHEISCPILTEDHADPLFLAPDDMAILTFVTAHDVQRDFAGNPDRARDVERCPCRRHIANGAIDAAAVELDRSGFQNTLSRFGTALFHAAASKAEILRSS
jgi:hypothetical protein